MSGTRTPPLYHPDMHARGFEAARPVYPQPPTFAGDTRDVSTARAWIRKVDGFFNFHGIQEPQRHLFALTWLGANAAQWWEVQVSMHYRDSDATWDDLKAAVMERYAPIEATISQAITKIRSLRQGKSTVAQYSQEFLLLWSQAELKDEALAKEFYMGGLEGDLVNHISDYSSLTLSQVIARAEGLRPLRAHLPAPARLAMGSSQSLVPMDIDQLAVLGPDGRLRPEVRQARLAGNLCLRCGASGHRVDTCPIGNGAGRRGKQTPRGRPGRSGVSQLVAGGGEGEVMDGNVNAPTALYPSVVHCSSLACGRPPLHVEVMVLGCKVRALVDSGCTLTLLSESLYRDLPAAHLASPSAPVEVRTADNTIHLSKTQLPDLHIIFRGRSTILPTTLVSTAVARERLVLGMDWLERANPSIDWARRTLSLPSRVEVAALSTPPGAGASGAGAGAVAGKVEQSLARAADQDLPTLEAAFRAEFSSSFRAELSGIPPSREVDFHIDLLPGTTPPSRPSYRHSEEAAEEIQRQVEDLLAKGLVRPSSSPYSAPVLLVPKGDGSKRLCVDYRGVNAVTVPNRSPLPRFDEVFDRLRGARVFSKLDFTSGYWQMRVRPEDVPKTAFATRTGLWEFLVLPFGLRNAPARFQALMNTLFRAALDKFVVVYQDDILVFSPSAAEHAEHLRWVFGVLRKAELYVKPSKTELFRAQVTFLGHRIAHNTIAPTEDDLATVRDWPAPTSTAQVRRFLGFINWLHGKIPQVATIAHPLARLLGNVPFSWGPEQAQAFQDLKEAVADIVPLRPFDPARPVRLVIYHDASGVGCGGVLMHEEEDGSSRPISFFSRALTERERRWPVHEQELLGFVEALKRWRHYLGDRTFLARTDNRSLVFLQSQAKLSPRQQRWLDLLAEFNYTIEHTPGRHNVAADALSRLPEEMGELSIQALESTLVLDQAFLTSVREGYALDPVCAELLGVLQGGLEHPPHLTHVLKHLSLGADGLLYHVGQVQPRLYVPALPALKSRILGDLHDSVLGGHRAAETMRVGHLYYWPRMHREVKAYVRSCPSCQRNRARNARPAGLLQPLAIPATNWTHVTLDFITKLPPTQAGADCILVVVDRRSKEAHFIPCAEPTAEETAHLFLKHVFRLHGLPLSLVSDRDPRFTSAFWSTLFRALGTSLDMSTADHPQTDGQTERTNRTLQDYLRHYVSYAQTNWAELLCLAEFHYNKSVHSSTGFSPFMATRGLEPLGLHDLHVPRLRPVGAESVAAFLEHISEHTIELQDNLEAAQQRQAHHADRSRVDLEYEEGQQVYVDAKHLLNPSDARRPSLKLTPRFTGPFTITTKLSATAYRLALPPGYAAHNVFHVSCLRRHVAQEELYHPGDEVPHNPEVPTAVLDHRAGRGRGGPLQFLLTWQGCPAALNSWHYARDPVFQVDPGATLLRAYRQDLGRVGVNVAERAPGG